MALLDIYTPEFWATETLMQLFERAPMLNLVYRDFENLVAREGDVINTRLPGRFTVDDITPGSFSSQTPKAVNVPVTLNKWRGNVFEIDDKTKSMSLPNLIDIYMKPAAEAIKKDVELAIFGLYPGVYNYIGIAGTTPTGVDKLGSDIWKQFETQLIGTDSRYVMLDLAAAAEYMKTFYNAFHADPGILNGGVLHPLFAQTYFSSPLVPQQTAGTRTGGTVNGVNAAVDPSNVIPPTAQTLAITGAGASATVKAGDLFIINSGAAAGAYAVTADVALNGSGAGTLTVTPPLRGATAGGETLTWIASHRVNLGFHHQAFALATRPLAVEPGLETGRVASVSYDGISLRTQIWRDPKDSKTYCKMDMLYGAAILDAAKAFRILG
jgi:hypothetical protein